MAELKTKPTGGSVTKFLDDLDNPQRRSECKQIKSIMYRITGKRPKMWGGSLVGYGSYHYRYKTGNEGDWFITGFSPRKGNLTIYVMDGFSNYADLL